MNTSEDIKRLKKVFRSENIPKGCYHKPPPNKNQTTTKRCIMSQNKLYEICFTTYLFLRVQDFVFLRPIF